MKRPHRLALVGGLPITVLALGTQASAITPPTDPPGSEGEEESATSVFEDGSDGSAAEDERPDDWVYITDDTDTIEIRVPNTWTDVETAEAQTDDGTFPRIEAATDLAVFHDTFDAPGVTYLALPFTEDTEAVIEEWGLTSGCVDEEIDDYDDDVWAGTRSTSTDCGGPSEFHLLAANSADRSFTALVAVQITGPEELEIVDWVFASFGAASGTAPDSSTPGGPTDSTEPGGPTQSTTPGGPTQTTGPGGPTQSTTPGGPTQTTGPGGPTQTTGPGGPTQTTTGPGGPTQTTTPTGPTQTTTPTGPTQTTTPTGPTQTSSPMPPTATTNPLSPTPTTTPLSPTPTTGVPPATATASTTAGTPFPPPSGDLPADWTRVVDDSQTIEIAVPPAWTFVNTLPGEETQIPWITATTDEAAFNADPLTFTVPGVRFIADPFTADTAGHIEQYTLSGDCTADPMQTYDDGVFVGHIQRFTACGGTATTVYILAANPADSVFTAYLEVHLTGAPDDAATLNGLLLSFNVAAGSGTAPAPTTSVAG